jgi:hypothetical protein
LALDIFEPIEFTDEVDLTIESIRHGQTLPLRRVVSAGPGAAVKLNRKRDRSPDATLEA